MIRPPEILALTFERILPHPVEKVWRALTQGPLLEDWLMRNDFEPVVGRPFSFRAEPMPHWDGVVHCEVLECEPLRRLAYSWRAMGLNSVVTWTLTPFEGGARLVMEQSGFPNTGGFYQGAQHGWGKMLDDLEPVLTRLD